MMFLKSRVPFTPQNPYRLVRPKTSKIIFLSCEGSVTEEEYFDLISDTYSGIRSKIQFISVAEDAVLTDPKCRTKEQIQTLTKVRPKHLVERIDQFKANEWDDAIAACQEKGYSYAISNPFFEIWLLLHHDEASEGDKSFAVSDSHSYEKTDHFRTRLSELGAPLKDKKHINPSDYNDEKIRAAVCRAEELHRNKEDPCPKYFATTVYLLLKKIIAMLPENI